jgi:acyl-CoA dehydrogenase
MNLAFTDEELAFAQEVREFLQRELPDSIREAAARCTTVFVDRDIALQWQAILARRGWAVPHWPVQYGGTDWTPAQRYIFTMECYRAGAPMPIPLGTLMLAPVIMAFGTEEQKDYYLPRMLWGEHYWCQGFSEPGAGSDLARLQTSAVADGDDYIVNGTKIWTTHAHFADHIFCLVRTSHNPAKPQEGLSFLLIDMNSPGLEVNPIITLAGDHEVNQIFFDDVRVPVRNRVGAEGQGWECAKYLLTFERGGGFLAHKLIFEHQHVRNLHQELRERDAHFDTDGIYARRIARLDIDLKALEITELRLLSQLNRNGSPGAESSVMKISHALLEQRIRELAADMLGYGGIVSDACEALPPGSEYVLPSYLNSRATTIFGGALEVQKNILAKTVLGL